MINLILSGGLGNQLFQYAYARAISEEFSDPEIAINPYFNHLFKAYNRLLKAIPSYLNCQLDLFELNPNVHEISGLKGITSAVENITVGGLIRAGIYNPNTNSEKFKKKTAKGKFKMFDFEYAFYEHAGECQKKNKVVAGWFQCEKYFSRIRPILLKELQFKKPPSQKNKEMIEELSACNSVCVHIRRGDLMNPRFAYISRPDGDYYKRGIDYIAERVDHPIFYVFSNNHNDLEWIKQNYDFGVPLKYVDLENPGHEDMRLMYHCKHFVISKSSFSWWGSYMSQSKDKIVVAPEMEMNPCWLNDQNMDDFYRDEMIKIPVKLDNRKTEEESK